MNTKRVILFVLIFSIVTLAIGSTVMADPLDWLKERTDETAEETKESVEKLGKNIYTIVNGFGYVFGFILLIVWGIKHWFAGGDSSAKKDLKDQGFNWLKGALIVFGASFIFNLVYTFVSGL